MFQQHLPLGLCAVVFLCQNVSPSSGAGTPRIITNSSQLSHHERRMLTLTLFKNIPTTSIPTELLVPTQPMDEYSFFDREILDVMMFFFEARNVAGKPLPELNWKFGLSFCFGVICLDNAWTVETIFSTFGTDTILSSMFLENNKFQYNFHVGNFTWSSPGAYVIDEDFIRGEIRRCEGFSFIWQNLSISISGDYDFMPNLGIQVSNMNIDYSVENNSYYMNACYEKYFGDEEWVPMEYENFDKTKLLMDYWIEYGANDTVHIEERLNCFLSEGKLDEELCNYNDELYRRYSSASSLQLFHVIGFGQMTRP